MFVVRHRDNGLLCCDGENIYWEADCHKYGPANPLLCDTRRGAVVAMEVLIKQCPREAPRAKLIVEPYKAPQVVTS